MEKNLPKKDELHDIVLKIIQRYEPIGSRDIWYELGEEYGLLGGIAGIPIQEVQEILSEMESRKVVAQENDQWRVRYRKQQQINFRSAQGRK